MGNPRERIAPFSDEWRAREATRCLLRDASDEPDPSSDKATKLPDFQCVTWAELRTAWSATEFKKNQTVNATAAVRARDRSHPPCVATHGQADQCGELELKKDGRPDSFALDQLRRMIDVALSDWRPKGSGLYSDTGKPKAGIAQKSASPLGQSRGYRDRTGETGSHRKSKPCGQLIQRSIEPFASTLAP